MSLKPERYKTYRARVHWHSPPSNPHFPDVVFPPDGSEVIARVAWLMGKDDPFPGEFALIIAETGLWSPERDLELLEEVSQEEAFADTLQKLGI